VADYLPRLLDGLLDEMVAAHPAVLVTGPRACGKTTSAARLARTIVRLDDPDQADVFKVSPDAALRALTDFPVLLDEWQMAPELLGAVKRAVDNQPGPGRFILSGSVEARMGTTTVAGTGRLVELAMTPLTVREQQRGRTRDPFLTRLAAGDDLAPGGPKVPDLLDYIEFALAGGFPEPLIQLDAAGRSRWNRSYISLLLGRDLRSWGFDADAPRLNRYMAAYAAVSGTATDHATIYRAADTTKPTGDRYERLLEALYLAEAIPPWRTNRLKRLVQQPKRVLADTGLWGALIEADARDVISNSGLLGRLIETFVINQLRAERPLTGGRPLFHLRTEGGRREVDLFAQVGYERFVALEIKAGGSVTRGDARHLIWLRDELGDAFVRGAVLHTGRNTFELDDRILAVPICAIWT